MASATTLNLGLPSYVDRVNAWRPTICVFGSVCEPQEMTLAHPRHRERLLKIGEDPGKVAVSRLGDFMVGVVEAQIDAAGGRLSGMYVWGDIAYAKGMFFSPDYWRDVYKPQLNRICEAIHRPASRRSTTAAETPPPCSTT